MVISNTTYSALEIPVIRGVGVDRGTGHSRAGDALWNRPSTPYTIRRLAEVTKGSQTCQMQGLKPTFDMIGPSIQALTVVVFPRTLAKTLRRWQRRWMFVSHRSQLAACKAGQSLHRYK